MGCAMSFAKVLVVLIFIGIIMCLGSGLIHMLKGKSPERTFKALRLRIGLSLGLFALLFLLAAMGLIEPHGGPI
jgi:NADH:ubiquinone oxidoreductase subunit 6 (subunit J)